MGKLFRRIFYNVLNLSFESFFIYTFKVKDRSDYVNINTMTKAYQLLFETETLLRSLIEESMINAYGECGEKIIKKRKKSFYMIL